MEEENKIMNVEEYFKEYSKLYCFEEYDDLYLIDKESFKEAMIAFAKYHVKEALEAGANNAYLDTINMGSSEFQTVVDKDSILNSYNLDNIK